MRPEVLERLKTLIREKYAGSWKDGWVYGRLKQEFDLQPDELEEIVKALGFKRGWNSAVKEILENQWQQEEANWMQRQLAEVQKQASLKRQKSEISQKVEAILQEIETLNTPKKELTDIERVLIALILKLNSEDQEWLLETALNRYKF